MTTPQKETASRAFEKWFKAQIWQNDDQAFAAKMHDQRVWDARGEHDAEVMLAKDDEIEKLQKIIKVWRDAAYDFAKITPEEIQQRMASAIIDKE